MHLYSGTSTDFVSAATRNRIGEMLRGGFFRHFRYWPPESEVRSWKNSLAAMGRVVEVAGLRDHGVICEYQLPMTSRRLDVMLTGHNDEGRPMASIVELKQWDGAEPSDIDELVTVFLGGSLRETLHPSVQVGQYRQYLLDTHEVFAEDKAGLRASSYLHNFTYDAESELYAARHAGALAVNPLFAGDQVDELAAWLNEELGGGGGVPLVTTVLEGRYRPNKKLLEHTSKIIKGEPAYVLLDEQRVAFNSVIAHVAEAHRTGTKAAFIIKGGPGTGKSVLAVNLVGELSANGYVTHHATGSRAFTGNMRKAVGSRAGNLFKYFNSYMAEDPDVLDVLICDEAHRIRETSANRFTPAANRTDTSQVLELLGVARVAVFFIDDMQVVRPGEIGSSELISSAANEIGANLYEYELEAQFRCAGSDAFVSWVENTLELRRTPDVIWDADSEFDFDVVDSPRELQALINQRANAGHSARLVAGFCWPWSNPESDGTLVDDVQLVDFSMPWNARPERKAAKGIPKAEMWATDSNGLQQVGCVYTAQGFEFDYVGLIFGRDLTYSFGSGWSGNPHHSHDAVVKRAAKESEEAFTNLVKQTYRVLFTRGLKGCYVYFEDAATRDFVLSRIDRRTDPAEVDTPLTDLAAPVSEPETSER